VVGFAQKRFFSVSSGHRFRRFYQFLDATGSSWTPPGSDAKRANDAVRNSALAMGGRLRSAGILYDGVQ
jgi:hypothetical protein